MNRADFRFASYFKGLECRYVIRIYIEFSSINDLSDAINCFDDFELENFRFLNRSADFKFASYVEGLQCRYVVRMY